MQVDALCDDIWLKMFTVSLLSSLEAQMYGQLEKQGTGNGTGTGTGTGNGNGNLHKKRRDDRSKIFVH